jgi:oligopeptide/dipeptide ABC transporter ATP-binding protein
MNRPAGCEFHNRCPYMGERCQIEAPAVSEAVSGHFYTCHYPLNTSTWRRRSLMDSER